MSAPFELLFTREAQIVLEALDKPSYRTKNAKVRKALRLLRDVGPSQAVHSRRVIGTSW